jgi:NADPH:quinone reductase-like Zn-dependent oxidoreductase
MTGTTNPYRAPSTAAAPSRSGAMRAIVRDRYGPPEVLELREVARPQIGEDEVLVRVRAAGVDRGAWHLMAGLPYPIRLAGYGLRAPKNPIIGSEVAGVVEAVGSSVTRFRPGDEVFGIGHGSFAEYVRVPEGKLAAKPANLTYAQAAAVPVSGLTALQAVRDHGKVDPGQDVLIIGASGGVGSYAVQLAKAFGARVTGVCSTSKVDLVRSLGADRVIDYARDDFADDDHRYDLILDIGGNSSLSRLRRALKPTGRLTIVGGETGGRWVGGFDRSLRAPMMSAFVSQDLGRPWVCSENHTDLIVLKGLIEAGKVTPALHRTFPLADAAKAIQYLLDGQVRGKTALTL